MWPSWASAGKLLISTTKEVFWRRSLIFIGQFFLLNNCFANFSNNVHTHNNVHLISYITKTLDIRKIIENRQIDFVIKGISHESKLIGFFFKHALISKNFCMRNINIIFKNNPNVKYSDVFLGTKVKLKEVKHDELWIDLINELMYLRDFRVFDILNLTEINHFLDHICTF